MATVYNIKNGKILDKKKSNKNFSSSLTKADDIANTIRIPNPHYNNPEGFDFSDSNLELNKNTDEQKMFKIFEKISPFIDELDTLLSKYKPDAERIKILSDVISYSLMTSNPVRSLKEAIRHYRITIGIKKALAFVGTSKNITQIRQKKC